MALPATGSQITMSQVRNYFSASGQITMSGLRGLSNYVSNSTTPILLSATFGANTFIWAISLAAILLPTVSIFTAASKVKNLAAFNSILDSAM